MQTCTDCLAKLLTRINNSMTLFFVDDAVPYTLGQLSVCTQIEKLIISIQNETVCGRIPALSWCYDSAVGDSDSGAILDEVVGANYNSDTHTEGILGLDSDIGPPLLISHEGNKIL